MDSRLDDEGDDGDDGGQTPDSERQGRLRWERGKAAPQ